MKKQIAALLLSLCLCPLAVASERDHERHLAPETVDYALILPANLPHVLRTANTQAAKLGLDEAQKTLIRDLMAEAPLKVFSRLQQAEKLEQAIAQDVLAHRQTLADVQTRLDELASLKRAATDAQIATINRIQGALSAAQFNQLLKLARRGEHH